MPPSAVLTAVLTAAPAPLPPVPVIDGRHAAWSRRTSRMKGAITPVLWWTWVGNLARRAYDNETQGNSPHGWDRVERLLRDTHQAWDQAQDQGLDRVRVAEYPDEQPAGAWAMGVEPWTGTGAQHRDAARILRPLRGFLGSPKRTFDRTVRQPEHQAQQERCMGLALDLLTRTLPGWAPAWFTTTGANAHPAFAAIQRHQPMLLNVWLERGLSPDLRADGRTLLQEAAWQGHPDLVDQLLARGASPSHRRWGSKQCDEICLNLPLSAGIELLTFAMRVG